MQCCSFFVNLPNDYHVDSMIDINDIKLYKENNKVEAKKAAGGLPNSLWETYSSFANTDGGIILLGVEEEKDGSFEVTGIQDPDRMLKDFWNIINNAQKVSVNILSDKNVQVDSVDGKNVIMIQIPRADRTVRPVFLNQNPLSGSYRRNGEGDYHCTKEEISAMFRDASNVSQDQKILRSKDFSAFSKDTIRGYRNVFNIIHPSHVWQDIDDQTFLSKIGAMGYDEEDMKLHPTVAGLLMFGYEYEMLQEFPQYFLDFQNHRDPSIRWTDRLTSSSGEWSGNLFDFFFNIMDKLTVDLPKPFKLDGFFRVDDTPLHKAVREALLNTLVNADYYGRRGVVIIKSPEGFSFANPGGFRMPVKEAIGGGISDPRNGVIFKMFSMLRLGERAGSGLPTVFQNWEDAYGEKPSLKESFNPDRVLLTLHCKNISDIRIGQEGTAMPTYNNSKPNIGTVNSKDGTVNEKSGTEDDTVNGRNGTEKTKDGTVTGTESSSIKSLLLAITECPSSTYEELSMKLGLSRRTIARIIKESVQKELIVREGTDKSGKWVITELGKIAAS